MAVVSWREILPRTFSHSFGSAMECERNFALTLDGPTNTQECLDAVGIQFGDSHPEYPTIYCLSGDLTETDFYHAELTVSYGVVDPNAPNSAGATGGHGGDGGGGGGGGGSGDDGNGPIANPLNRPDVWNFSTSTVEVPCTEAYTDGPNSVWAKPGTINYLNETGGRVPVVNSAGDSIWSGLTKTVGQTKVTIKGNRSSFNWTQAQYVTGRINAKTWMNTKPGFWMCQGVSATPQAEQVGNVTVKFWEVNVELIYREGGFISPLINSGLNYIGKDKDGKTAKLRVFLKSEGMPDPGVPADLPVALKKDGSLMRPAEEGDFTKPSPYIEPLTMYYRVNGSCNFEAYFGSGPPGGIFPVA